MSGPAAGARGGPGDGGRGREPTRPHRTPPGPLCRGPPGRGAPGATAGMRARWGRRGGCARAMGRGAAGRQVLGGAPGPRRADRGPGQLLVRSQAGDLRERRPAGSPGGRRERRRVAWAETEARAPEAWARGRTARRFRSPLLQRAGSSEAFRARGEYRPAAIVIGSRLDIFSLKRRWGLGVGGVRASGRGSASCRGPEGLWLQGGAESLWALVAGFC